MCCSHVPAVLLHSPSLGHPLILGHLGQGTSLDTSDVQRRGYAASVTRDCEEGRGRGGDGWTEKGERGTEGKTAEIKMDRDAERQRQKEGKERKGKEIGTVSLRETNVGDKGRSRERQGRLKRGREPERKEKSQQGESSWAHGLSQRLPPFVQACLPTSVPATSHNRLSLEGGWGPRTRGGEGPPV